MPAHTSAFLSLSLKAREASRAFSKLPSLTMFQVLHIHHIASLHSCSVEGYTPLALLVRQPAAGTDQGGGRAISAGDKGTCRRRGAGRAKQPGLTVRARLTQSTDPLLPPKVPVEVALETSPTRFRAGSWV